MLKSSMFTNIPTTHCCKLSLIFAVSIICTAAISYADETTSAPHHPAAGSIVRPMSLQNPPPQRGIALGLFRQEKNWDYQQDVDEMKAHGASHVAIVVSHYVKTDRHSKVYELPKYTAPTHTLEQTIDQVHQAGMKVFLFPILRVEDKSNGGWRGTLQPDNISAFFTSYNEYIAKLARIAQKHNVALFSIGSELSTMDVHTNKWRAIIKTVRESYQGKITYSANWDHYEKVEFFEQLDFIGVTGYFKLSKQKPPYEANPPIKELIHSWREIYYRILRWQRVFNKPLIFTEVGYLSQKGAASEPWNEGVRGRVDLEIQRRCYEAFMRIWDDEPALAGAYFWNWFDWEGENDEEYTPRNKPAAGEIIKWYKGIDGKHSRQVAK